MRTKKNDLLTEVNIMRSMMGLRENKTLIMEQGIIGLAKAFVKSATELAVKSADNLMDEIMGGVGSLAAANRMKTMVDDLDAAVKVGDEAAMKAVVTNLVNSTDFGAGITTKIVDDMFANTADDALTSMLTKKANGLKARGLPDAQILKALKDDVDNLLSGFPDRLVSAAKNKIDNTIKFGNTNPIKVITVDDVLSKLGSRDAWAKIRAQDSALADELISEIDLLLKSGAKSADEVAETLIKNAEARLAPTPRERWLIFKKKHPYLVKYGKTVGGVLLAYVILRIAAGKAKLPAKIYEVLFCDLFVPEGSNALWCEDVRSMINDLESQSNSNQNTNTSGGNCDKTEADFRTYLKKERNYTDLDTNTAYGAIVWDQKTCSGSIMNGDVQFTYNMDTKTWS